MSSSGTKSDSTSSVEEASILSELHDTHPRIVRMKAITHSRVWWLATDRQRY